MTHDHAEDAALCDAALRCAHLGLDRADRLVGEVGAVPQHAGRRGPRRPTPSTGSRRRSALPELDRQGPRDDRGRASRPRSSAVVPAGRQRRRMPSRHGTMTLFRGDASSTPPTTRSPGASLRAGGRTPACWSRDGVIVDRGAVRARAAAAPGRGGRRPHAAALVLPGLVDTHVHYPQVRAIGGAGHAAAGMARAVRPPGGGAARRRRRTPRRSRPSSSSGLVDGGHDHGARLRRRTSPRPSTRCSPRPPRVGLRVTSGLVVSDRILRDDLLTTPDRAYDEGLALAQRWHGTGAPGTP